jgi:hypothetical protein
MSMTDQNQSDAADRDPPPQPDPALRMMDGQLGAIGLTLLALVSALILGIVLYGLNAGDEAG